VQQRRAERRKTRRHPWRALSFWLGARLFPVLVSELDLTYGQAEQLERAWFHFRRRVSRRVAAPEQN